MLMARQHDCRQQMCHFDSNWFRLILLQNYVFLSRRILRFRSEPMQQTYSKLKVHPLSVVPKSVAIITCLYYQLIIQKSLALMPHPLFPLGRSAVINNLLLIWNGSKVLLFTLYCYTIYLQYQVPTYNAYVSILHIQYLSPH